MPLDADARRALLDRILASGDRRRRRWLLGPSIAAVAALALLLVLLPGDGASSRLDVSVEGTETTTTLDSSDPSPDTTEVPGTSSTTAVPDESTSTSSPAPVCRNSQDPRCGPFYWDYDPDTWPNAPLELSISHEPGTIVAGEPVTFSLRFYDPDVARADNCARSWFPGSDAVPDDQPGYSGQEPEGGELRFLCAVPGCAIYPDRYGPWDPPPPESSAPVTQSVTRVYQEPGEYTVRAEAESRWWCRFEGYDSAATHSITIRVVPPPTV